MPVTETKHENFIGYNVTAAGDTVLNNKNFVAREEVSKPNVEHRIRPLNLAPFSNAHTPRTFYSKTRTTTQWWRDTKWTGMVENTPAAYYNAPGFLGQTCFLDLRTKLLNKIKDEKISLGISLAEYRSTAGLFSRTSSLVSEVLRGKKQLVRNVKRVLFPIKGHTPHVAHAKLLADAGEGYLTYHFGYEQFSSDVNGALQLLQDRLRDPIVLGKNVSGKNTEIRAIVKTKDGKNASVFVTELVVKRLKSAYTVIPHLYDVNRAGIPTSFSGVAYVVWDWVPFSWVLDQLIDVGSYLSALDALSGVDNFRAYETEFYKYGSQHFYDNRFSTLSYEYLNRGGLVTSMSPPLPTYAPSATAKGIASDLAALALLRKNPTIARTYMPRSIVQ